MIKVAAFTYDITTKQNLQKMKSLLQPEYTSVDPAYIRSKTIHFMYDLQALFYSMKSGTSQKQTQTKEYRKYKAAQ